MQLILSDVTAAALFQGFQFGLGLLGQLLNSRFINQRFLTLQTHHFNSLIQLLVAHSVQILQVLHQFARQVQFVGSLGGLGQVIHLLFPKLELHRLASLGRLDRLTDDLLHVSWYLLVVLLDLALGAAVQEAAAVVRGEGGVSLRRILL